jgi:hypothetical protein
MPLTEDESVIETMRLLVSAWTQQLKILLLITRETIHFGPVNFMMTKEKMGSLIKWPFVLWHLNGFAFCIDVGKNVNLMTK